jgi:hypothetical protein
MTSDFRADQIQLNKIISSGSTGTGASILIYPIESEDGLNPNTGQINPNAFDSGSIGSDVFLYVSGAVNSRDESDSHGVTVFGGDVFVSGNLNLGSGSINPLETKLTGALVEGDTESYNFIGNVDVTGSVDGYLDVLIKPVSGINLGQGAEVFASASATDTLDFRTLVQKHGIEVSQSQENVEFNTLTINNLQEKIQSTLIDDGNDANLPTQLSFDPATTGSVLLFLNGLHALQGDGQEYTITSSGEDFRTIRWLNGSGVAQNVDATDVFDVYYVASDSERIKINQEQITTEDVLSGSDVDLVATLFDVPITSSVLLFLNGIYQAQGSTKDYLLTGSDNQTIRWLADTGTATPLSSSDILTAFYFQADSNVGLVQERIDSETIFGIDQNLGTFLSFTPKHPSSVLLFLNGSEQRQGRDYLLTGKSFRTIRWLAGTGEAPGMNNTDLLDVYYLKPEQYSLPDFRWTSVDSSLYTDKDVVIGPIKETSAKSIGSDVHVFISGTISSGSSGDRIPVFGGSVRFSGALNIGNDDATKIQSRNGELWFYDPVIAGGTTFYKHYLFTSKLPIALTNSMAFSITEGQAVFEPPGGNHEMMLAIANDATGSKFLGIVPQAIPEGWTGTIAAGSVGEVQRAGDAFITASLQEGTTWLEGDRIYLSTITSGSYTNLMPTGSGEFIVPVGKIVLSNEAPGLDTYMVIEKGEIIEID